MYKLKRSYFVFLSLLICLVGHSQDIEIAYKYFNSAQYAKAAKEFEIALPSVLEKYGKNDTSQYAKILIFTAISFERIQQDKTAEQYYLKAKLVYELNNALFDIWYGASINNLGLLYYRNGNYTISEDYFKQASEIVKKSEGETSPRYATSLNNLAMLYNKIGNFEFSKPLLIEASIIFKNLDGESHPNYATSLNNLAEYYRTIGKYSEAEPLYKQALAIRKKQLGETHKDYATSLNNLALLYRLMGKYRDSEPLFLEALKINKDILGEFHPDYATMLDNLAGLYDDIGRLDEAEIIYKNVLSIKKATIGELHPDFATTLNNLALFYKTVGNYQAALPLYKQACEIYKNALGENHPLYANSLDNLASLYRNLGNYQMAESLCKQGLEIRKIVLGDKSPDYSASLNNLAMIYDDLGNYKSAEILYKKTIEINKDVFGENHPTYAKSIGNLAGIYVECAKYQAAEILYKQALEIDNQTFGQNHLNYATDLNNLSELYRKMGNYSAAISVGLQSLEIRKAVVGEKSSDYTTSLCNIGLIYYSQGKYQLAEPFLKQALEIKKANSKESQKNYSTLLMNLAALYQAQGNLNLVEPLYLEANTILNINTKNNFSFLSELEKENYINEIAFNYDFFQSYTKKNSSSSPTFYGSIFNNELLRKGIVLASWAALQKSIDESGDTSLRNKYEKLRSIKQKINRMLQITDLESKIDLVNLEKNANELEKKIILESSDYALMNQQFSINWKMVQEKLNPTQAAIEFISFDYFNGKKWTDSTLYCALILRKYDEYPKIVYLYEEKQLNALLPRSFSDPEGIRKTYSLNLEESKAKDIYQLIMGPIEPYLEGVKTINFAVSGQLNKIAFHALTDTSGNMMLNKYNLVQLSSTREIAITKTDRQLESITIFGGIDYCLDTTNMLANAREYGSDNLPRSVYRSDSIDRNLNLNYLPGSMKEAQELGDACREKGMDVKLYTGAKATEERFREIGEKKSPSVIHIATHGFYFPEEKQKDRKERMGDTQFAHESQFIYSPDPLIRSGILMAGANHAWKGEKIPDEVEDGILTAREVSQMNLLNTELVVLSACQTGLGDVKGSEGVYGLQRAFKMAGARYLMLSLWKVPDETTTEYMITFYGHLSSGTSIRDSYQNTQKEMNVKYPDEPYKWAAFVLVE